MVNSKQGMNVFDLDWLSDMLDLGICEICLSLKVEALLE
jgi:hypothetical protein